MTARFALTCFALLSLGLAVTADVPDPSVNAPLAPDAIALGAPDAIRPGTRLTYFGTNATVVGQRIRLVLDGSGNWVVKESEKRFETGNSGGVGYTVVRVGHIDNEVAAISTSAYLLNPATNIVSASANEGFVSNAGCGGPFWIHPEALAKLKDSKDDGCVVLRQSYVVNNHKYNAIRITTESASSYTAQVFDLETGIKIFHASALISEPTFTRFPNGQMQKVEGSTHTSTAALWDSKVIDLPWKKKPAPAWVGTFREIQYEGSSSAVISGVEYSVRTSASITSVARKEGWLRFVLKSLTENPGLPASEGTQNFSAGNASLGGLWIPQDGLAELKEEQVLETNDIIGTKMVVLRVAKDSVTLRESGRIHRVDTTYDKDTGLMSKIVVQQETPTGSATNQLTLKGRK
ncbi:MAG: hypothetical protein K8T20_08555 [Planctomycetes bacterium]|nr:hypothetical protein [Planctomycetota bacterium]